ncbi:MFS transporter [Kribbella sp. NBC_01505]|uniref:MFS transporter n=1 Tax=Kribbella sp. NBC_01505 TaxID=2903580 RepID=UPI0038668F0F
MSASTTLRRNRDFKLLLSGQVVSFVGDQAQDIALPLLVLGLTGSSVQAGLVLGLNTASYLVFGLLAGALVDRWDRKTTMIWCEIGRALLTVSVIVALAFGHLTMPHLYVMAGLTGILTTLFQVANTAALPSVVGTTQLPAALGYTQSALNTVRIFGASLAGILYSAGRTVPFLVNAVSFTVSAASLRLMRADFQEERRIGSARLRTDVREGLSWLWGQPVIRFLTLASAADNLRYGAGYLIIITLAQGVSASPLEIGLIFSAAAVGAMLGSLVSHRAIRRFRLGRIAVVMLWIEALTFPLYALAPNPLLLGVVAAAESLIAPIYAVAISTHRLTSTPDRLRGRTASAAGTLTTGALAVGAMLGGVLIASLGPKSTVLICAAWLAALAILTTANRAVRQAPVVR